MNHLDGKVVVVTGAGSGFGRIVATMLAERGARVVGVDIAAENVLATVHGIRATGGDAVDVRADVCSQDDMDEVVRIAVAEYGRVDVLVNNAGIMPLSFFADHARSHRAWDLAIDVNLKGMVHGISAVYDQMIAQGAGHVVNISSIFGNAGVAGGAVYGATKAAVNTISDALRIEAKGKIKVTTVKPSAVPGTGLREAVINHEARLGLLGAYREQWVSLLERAEAGSLDPAYTDPNDIRYMALTPEQMAEVIVYTIDQPWGVSISDLTLRASGDLYVY